MTPPKPGTIWRSKSSGSLYWVIGMISLPADGGFEEVVDMRYLGHGRGFKSRCSSIVRLEHFMAWYELNDEQFIPTRDYEPDCTSSRGFRTFPEGAFQ